MRVRANNNAYLILTSSEYDMIQVEVFDALLVDGGVHSNVIFVAARIATFFLLLQV